MLAQQDTDSQVDRVNADGVVNLLPGKILRRAREEKGLSHNYVLSELKLEPQLLQAIENDDFDALPPPTYVRGYLRQYANLVDIDPGKLVALYESATGSKGASPMIQGKAYGASKITKWAFPYPYVFIFAALMLGTFVGVEMLWTSDSDSRDRLVQQQPDVATDEGQEVADIAPVTGELPPSPADIQLAEEVAVLEAVTANPELNDLPAVGAAVTELSAEPVETEELAAFESTSRAALAENSIDHSAAWGKINLQFSDFTWVDIRDADGVRVIVGNFPGGLVRNAEGRLPFAVEIGNAKGVKLALNGKQVALAPYLRGDVARFTLRVED